MGIKKIPRIKRGIFIILKTKASRQALILSALIVDAKAELAVSARHLRQEVAAWLVVI